MAADTGSLSEGKAAPTCSTQEIGARNADAK